MQRSGRTGELRLELDAVEMAKNEIIRLSREYGDERRDEINSVVSRYVSAITEENTIWRKWTKQESSACRRREERFCRRRSAEERWNSSILRSAWQSEAL